MSAPPPRGHHAPAIATLTVPAPGDPHTRLGLHDRRPSVITAIDHRRDVASPLSWSGAPLIGSKAMTPSGTTWTAALGPFAEAPAT